MSAHAIVHLPAHLSWKCIDMSLHISVDVSVHMPAEYVSYTYLYTYPYICLHACLFMCPYTYLHICLYTSMPQPAKSRTHLHAHICTHVMNIHKHVHTNVPSHVHAHIDTDVSTCHPATWLRYWTPGAWIQFGSCNDIFGDLHWSHLYLPWSRPTRHRRVCGAARSRTQSFCHSHLLGRTVADWGKERCSYLSKVKQMGDDPQMLSLFVDAGNKISH